MKRWIFAALISTLFLSVPRAHAGGPDMIVGKWLTQNKHIEIEIYKVNGKYNGKITWLKEPHYPAGDQRRMTGMPRVDRENPDPSKKDRPLVGMDILRGFDFIRESHWENGTVYDPRDGRTYKCKIFCETPDELKVRGFIGVSLFGKTLTLKKN